MKNVILISVSVVRDPCAIMMKKFMDLLSVDVDMIYTIIIKYNYIHLLLKFEEFKRSRGKKGVFCLTQIDRFACLTREGGHPAH